MLPKAGGEALLLRTMSQFIDLLVFPAHLEHEFSDQEKVCAPLAVCAGLTNLCGYHSGFSGVWCVLSVSRTWALPAALIGRLRCLCVLASSCCLCPTVMIPYVVLATREPTRHRDAL